MTPDLRAIRLACGHTQAQAAEHARVSLSLWQSVEQGRRELPAASLELYLLIAGQHPAYRLTRRRSP